ATGSCRRSSTAGNECCVVIREKLDILIGQYRRGDVLGRLPLANTVGRVTGWVLEELRKSSLGRRLVQRLKEMLPQRLRQLLLNDGLRVYPSSRATRPQGRSILIATDESSSSREP